VPSPTRTIATQTGIGSTFTQACGIHTLLFRARDIKDATSHDGADIVDCGQITLHGVASEDVLKRNTMSE